MVRCSKQVKTLFVALLLVSVLVNIKITSLIRIQDNLEVRWVSHETAYLTNTNQTKVLERCPPLPKHPTGKVDININRLNSTDYQGTDVKPGGLHTPLDCESRHHVAIVVPYRDREDQLQIFPRYMHLFLQKQNISYGIYVIKPVPGVKFNRGLLLNIGFIEINKLREYDCFIFHDVDLLPENEGIPYTCDEMPLHMAVAQDTKKYKLPYRSYFGGVCAFTKEQFKKVNGFSNVYFDWGGEDDDMYERVKYNNLTVIRLPRKLGRYKMLPHVQAKINPDRFLLLNTMKARHRTDGLNSLKYHVVKQKTRRLYTRILVNVNETEIMDRDPIHSGKARLRSSRTKPLYRTGNHRLPIETGRWRQSFVPYAERKCRHCQLNDLGDEFHYLIKCPFFPNNKNKIDP